MNEGPKHEYIRKNINKILAIVQDGCQVLYNGQTGEQMEANIFIGPTYYMRLKHMVKDKINYRSKGPRQTLTSQNKVEQMMED